MGKHLRKWESTYEEINYNLFKNDIIVGSCLLQAAHIDVYVLPIGPEIHLPALRSSLRRLRGARLDTALRPG